MRETRYIKNHNTISLEEQQILLQKNVTIIGCGGLGQNVASQLSRIGIGTLNIVDYDFFEESNLNRQIFCNTQNIGKSKVIETEKQIKLINPDIHINVFNTKFNKKNSKDILKVSDIVIDALDSIESRLIVQKACEEMNFVLISAAIGGWYGMLTVIRPTDDTLSKIYSDDDHKGIETELGNPAFIPALLASFQVSETIKFLLNKPIHLYKKVLYVDLLSLSFYIHDIEVIK